MFLDEIGFEIIGKNYRLTQTHNYKLDSHVLPHHILRAPGLEFGSYSFKYLNVLLAEE